MNYKRSCVFGFLPLFLVLMTFSSCDKKEDNVDTIPPGIITGLTATPQDGQVILNWTEPDDPDLARIEISYVPGSDIIYSQECGLNRLTLTGLANGTAYEFSVVTVDEAGNKSDAATVTAVPNTPFLVVHPDQNNYSPAGGTFTTDGSGHLIISVTFNRAVDVSSVVPAMTIYFEGDAVSQGTVSFSNNNKTLTFTTTDQASDFGTRSRDLYFDFLLIGDDAGKGAVKDTNGMLLDGDENGVGGGNYILNLYIIG